MPFLKSSIESWILHDVHDPQFPNPVITKSVSFANRSSNSGDAPTLIGETFVFVLTRLTMLLTKPASDNSSPIFSKRIPVFGFVLSSSPRRNVFSLKRLASIPRKLASNAWSSASNAGVKMRIFDTVASSLILKMCRRKKTFMMWRQKTHPLRPPVPKCLASLHSVNSLEIFSPSGKCIIRSRQALGATRILVSTVFPLISLNFTLIPANTKPASSGVIALLTIALSSISVH